MPTRTTPIKTASLRLPLVLATGVLALLTLAGCNSTDGEYATNEFVTRAITESDARKKKAREAAEKREAERLARKKARRAATEKVGWQALAELEKYRSAHCYSPDIRSLQTGTQGATHTAAIVTQPLIGASRSYGSDSGGGGENPGC
ncbi:hypothetical protein [uncultured Hoeflea sp.]|uniref:hypothetical protein n=1 Tax=uncultured Hoeflea sp. TaxID=538666 RepID=UPI002603065B|nr:hypothetical protein [uncultured Hoeflea sp.]